MKRILFSLLTLMATAAALHADNLSVPDTPMAPGATQTVDIALSNTATDYLGFQMTLSLPAGVSPVKAQCALSDRFGAGQELSIGRKGDGTYTLFWASLDGTAISGTSGAIIHLTLTAGDSFNGGTATLSNIRFANSQGQRVTLDNCSFALTLASVEAYALMSTDGKTLTFYNDRLKNFREGTAYALNTSYNDPGWYSDDGLPVTKVVFDPSFDAARPTSTRRWFSRMGSLTTIEGIEYLHTDEVTSMLSMFAYCSSLTALDVSGFNTAKVTTMISMFYNCSSLTALNVSDFNTVLVTDMSGMFYNCSSLTALDVSGFNTAKVTNMNGMFQLCKKLTSLDVSGFITTEVKYMSWMFSACYALQNLDVSGFNTAKVTTMSGMFHDCHSLGNIDLSSFNTANVTTMGAMFQNCKQFTAIDVSQFDTGKVTEMGRMFKGCINLTSLDLSSFDNTSLTSSNEMLLQCSALTNLTLPACFSGINDNACTSVGTEAAPCELYVPDSFDFGDVDTSGSAFQWKTGWFHLHREAYALLSADGKTLSFYYDNSKNVREGTAYELNTSSSNPGWYSEQSTVTKVVFDPSFDAVRPTSTLSWFVMKQLTTIEGLEYLHTDEVTDMGYMFWCCNSLATLDVTHFNTSKVRGMRFMFAGMESLTSLDVSHFDTSNVTDMMNMFHGCSKLTSLDVTHFDTRKVTGMRSMFYNCKSLSNLDVSGFVTSNVTNMSHMFRDCAALTSIDVSGFNTEKVTEMEYMFSACYNLQSLDLSGFSTAKVTDMSYMFNGCKSLTSLDLSNFNMDSVANTEKMLNNCSALTTLTLPVGFSGINDNACTSVGTEATPCELYVPDSFDFGDVDTSASAFQWKSGWFHRFSEPYALLSADGKTLSFYCDNSKGVREGTAYELNTGKNLPQWYVADGSSAVTKVVFDPSFDKVRPTTGHYWLCEMRQLTTIEGMEYLHTEEMTSMCDFFRGCKLLTSLDLSGFNTEKVKNMTSMFKDCSGLTSLDLSSFDTSNVTSTRLMFCGCVNLESVEISSFDTSNVTNMNSMFNSCRSLTSLDVSGFITDNVTNMGLMFAGCSSLTDLDVSSFITDNVTNMNGLFKGCSGLTGLDLISFFTDNVTDMGEMFRGCAGLTGLDLISFITDNVTNMNGMFVGCTGLTSLDLSGFVTDNVTDMSSMFAGCTGLTALDLSAFGTTSLTSSSGMMANCSALADLTLPLGFSSLDEDACEGVGTQAAPCKLNVPDGFDFGSTVPAATYQWKGGWFGTANAFLLGDVNHDMTVTVTDVMMTVNAVVSIPPAGFYPENADMNGDHDINVADIMMIVKIVVGN